MQGMNFGMDGPSITGWWVNPQTGDKFKAIDTYFEDNNLLIKTADGRLLNYNQIQNYVQTDKPESFKGPDKQAAKQEEEIPAEVLNEIDNGEGPDGGLLIPDDNIYGDRSPRQAPSAELGNIYRKEEPQLQPAVQDFAIIDRALAGKDIPSLIANVEWNGCPKREIEMLVDVMNISEDEIVRYYFNRISKSMIQSMIEEGIRSYIYHVLHVHDDGTNGQFVGSHVKVTSGPELDRMIEEERRKREEAEQHNQGLVVDPNKVPKEKKTKKKVNG